MSNVSPITHRTMSKHHTLRQRTPSERLQGFNIIGPVDHETDTTHTLIDDNVGPGLDGKPGNARVDDDGNGVADNDEEAGWPDTDDTRLGIYETILNFLRRLTGS